MGGREGEGWVERRVGLGAGVCIHIGGQDCAFTEGVGDGGREAEVQELQAL